METKIMKKGKLIELAFKHEGESNGQIIGPLWRVYEQLTSGIKDGFTGEPVTTICENYENGMPQSDEGYYAKWFSLHKARLIAKSLNIPLQEY